MRQEVGAQSPSITQYDAKQDEGHVVSMHHPDLISGLYTGMTEALTTISRPRVASADCRN